MAGLDGLVVGIGFVCCASGMCWLAAAAGEIKIRQVAGKTNLFLPLIPADAAADAAAAKNQFAR